MSPLVTPRKAYLITHSYDNRSVRKTKQRKERLVIETYSYQGSARLVVSVLYSKEKPMDGMKYTNKQTNYYRGQ